MPELELPYRLIALDLDGTLLNPQKELTEGNRRISTESLRRLSQLLCLTVIFQITP